MYLTSSSSLNSNDRILIKQVDNETVKPACQTMRPLIKLDFKKGIKVAQSFRMANVEKKSASSATPRKILEEKLSHT